MWQMGWFRHHRAGYCVNQTGTSFGTRQGFCSADAMSPPALPGHASPDARGIREVSGYLVFGSWVSHTRKSSVRFC